jgi:two-component system sensor histidine kinase ComP
MGVVRQYYLFGISLFTVLILALYLIFSTIMTPFIGLDVQKKQSGEWQVSEINKLSWAETQGINVGDIVILVNQHPPGDHPTIKKFYAIEHVETLELKRNGKTLIYHVSKELIPNQLIYHTVIPTFCFVVLLLLSIFLYMKKRDDTSAILLIFFFLSIGFSYLSAGASSRGDEVARLIIGISFLFIPLLFLHFLYRYFIRYQIRMFHYRLLSAFYGVTGLLALFNFIFIICNIGLLNPILRDSKLVVFSIGIFICLYVLISSYIRYRKTIHKPVLKLMVLAMFLAFFPYVGLVIIATILFGQELLPGPIAAVFLLILPVVFMYLITANRLLDIDFIIHRIRYYSILSLFPTVMIVPFIVYLNRGSTLGEWVKTSIFIYIIIVAFLYVKEKLNFLFQSKLFTEKYNFQASLDRFSYDIAKVMKVSDLEERFIIEIKSVLDIKSVSLLELDEQNLSLNLKRGHSDFPELLITAHFKDHSSLISVGELIDIHRGLFLIVGKNKNKYSLVWIHDKINRVQLNRNERVWLKTFAQYISLVYENLYLIEGLTDALEEAVTKQKAAPSWILRFIFSLSEKERRRLAFDLHDSSLQDLLFWNRKLENILIKYDIKDEIKDELNHVKEGLLDVVEQIRETCTELLPPFLKEIGIVEVLENLFTQVRLRANYAVNFNKTGFHANLDDDQLLALYRIVQELLRNASRHSDATRVDIKLSNANGNIYFHYRDNGIGMNLEHYQPSFKHMGLHGIEERVTSLEGETSFRSTLGNGFEVSIWMPAAIQPVISEKVEEDPYDTRIVG